MAEAQTISSAQLCTLTGLSDRRHRQLAGDGYFPPPIKGQYQFAPTLQGLFRYYRDQQSKGSDEFATERLRKTRAEANLAEIRLHKERRNAFDRKAVLRTWENIIMVIRQKLLALPSKMSPRLAYMDDQKAIEADLEKEVRDALEELSKPQAYEDEVETEIQAGDNASTEAPEAAA